MTLRDWREHEAQRLWSRARVRWHEEHSWPTGLSRIDLLRESLALRRAAAEHGH
jgi:uncharacterized FlgJ-related protein